MTLESTPAPAAEKSVERREPHVVLEKPEQYSPRQLEGAELLKKIVDRLPAPKKAEAMDPETRFEKIGLAFCLGRGEGSYTEDGQYTGILMPWDNEPGANGSKKPKILLNKETLKGVIGRIKNPGDRAVCKMHLDKMIALFEEEKTEMEQDRKARLRESAPDIGAIETLLAAFETNYDLAALLAISTEEEALASDVRKAANTARGEIRNKLTALGEETNADFGTKEALFKKYLKLSQAVGVINGGKVDHTRTS